MNKDLIKNILLNTNITVQYKLVKNRVIQSMLIDIFDCTDQIDIFNLMQYLNDRVSNMFYGTVRTNKDIKEYLKSLPSNKETFSQPVNYRIPSSFLKVTPLHSIYTKEIDGVYDIIESFIGYYLTPDYE